MASPKQPAVPKPLQRDSTVRLAPTNPNWAFPYIQRHSTPPIRIAS